MVENRVFARGLRLLPSERRVARRLHDPSRDRFVSPVRHSVERKVSKPPIAGCSNH